MTTNNDSTGKLYSVRDWDDNFENNRTRKMKHMMWVPVPNKHDGDGYTELVDREDGAEMLGAWLAILQVASKCAIRGTLVRDNSTPHTPKTIARQTRLKEGVVCKALDLLCSSDIGWLQVVDNTGVAPRCAIGAPSAHPVDEEEKEEKGIEEKGSRSAPALESVQNQETEQQQSKASPAPVKKKREFRAPTESEVRVWAGEWALKKERNPKGVCAVAEEARQYYERMDWTKANGKKVKVWKTTIAGVWLTDEKITRATTGSMAPQQAISKAVVPDFV